MVPAPAPAVPPDARQADPHDPRRRRLALRAEVGRVPLHRVPRRRRHRAGQPQRAAVHPLLPRADRAAQGVAARALRRRRRDRRRRPRRQRARLRRPAAAHPPRRVAGPPPRRGDAGVVRRLRPAGARRRRRCSSARCRERRAELLRVLRPKPPVHLTPASTDPATAAEWFGRFEGAGLDGVVAKRLDDPYQPDKRALVKVKHERTADCAVAGYRIHKDGNGVGSLLLGLYDDDGNLQHVGVAAAFSVEVPRRAARRAGAADRGRRSTTTRGPTGPSGSTPTTARKPGRDAAGGTPARTSRGSRSASSASPR